MAAEVKENEFVGLPNQIASSLPESLVQAMRMSGILEWDQETFALFYSTYAKGWEEIEATHHLSNIDLSTEEEK